jgi:chromosome segregation ATPase
MREASQRAKELQRQAVAARSSLNEAAAKVAELEQQAASAQQAISQYEEQERAIARALQEAQRTTEELLRSAKARAEEAIAAGKSAGEGIVQAARTTATETLQRARESAQEQIQAAEQATAAAKAAADEIVQNARTAAAETLDRARESAQEQLRAAERTAAEHLARLRAESDELVEETNRKVQEVRQAADHHLTGVTAKLDAFVRDREEISRGLDGLARSHAESLQMMTRLRSEVQGQILPAVHRLLRRLKGEGVGDADDTGAVQAPSAEPEATAAHSAVEERRPASEAGMEQRPGPDAAARDAEPAREAAAPEREAVHEAAEERETAPEAAAPEPKESGASAVRHIGQIVVSPIHSFLQATKFMTALSQVKGVASVKLRTYSGAKATIEVVTVGHTVGDINFRAISGFSIEVVESTDTHLALKLSSPTARPVPG